MNYFVHESAIVDRDVTIGCCTKIWHFSHLESGAIVGENCNLGQGTYVGNKGVIGNACRIGNNVSIFSNVILEDFVFCAPYMVFTHISYPRAVVSRKKNFDTTLVKTGATLGANCSVIPGVTVGMGAFVAAGAILTKPCKDWALMVGTPAKHIGWVSAYGEKIPLPLIGSGEWRCRYTNDLYILENDNLQRISSSTDILRYEFGKKYQRILAP